MKKGTLILVLAMALVGLTGRAWAQTDTIEVTVSLASVVSVNVTPAEWNMGAIATEYVSSSEPFVAGNDGNVTEDFTITGANAANNWNIGSPAALDTFQVELTDNDQTDIPLTTSPIALESGVAAAGTHDFSLVYSAPTSDAQGGGKDHSFTITVTASASPP